MFDFDEFASFNFNNPNTKLRKLNFFSSIFLSEDEFIHIPLLKLCPNVHESAKTIHSEILKVIKSKSNCAPHLISKNALGNIQK